MLIYSSSIHPWHYVHTACMDVSSQGTIKLIRTLQPPDLSCEMIQSLHWDCGSVTWILSYSTFTHWAISYIAQCGVLHVEHKIYLSKIRSFSSKIMISYFQRFLQQERFEIFLLCGVFINISALHSLRMHLCQNSHSPSSGLPVHLQTFLPSFSLHIRNSTCRLLLLLFQVFHRTSSTPLQKETLPLTTTLLLHS